MENMSGKKQNGVEAARRGLMSWLSRDGHASASVQAVGLVGSVSRRRWLQGGLQWLAGGVMAACLSSVALAAPDVPAGDKTLRLGFIGPGKDVGGAVGWALHKGYLQEAVKPFGYTAVTQHVFPNGPDLNEALLSGKLDIGVYGDTPALFARSSGGAPRLLGLNNVAMDAWLVAPPGGAKTLADLSGKRVGVPRGSYLHRYIAGLQEAGLVSGFEQVHLFPRDAQPALERGDIAAYTAPIGLGPQLKGQGYTVIDLASQHGLQGNSVIVAPEALLVSQPGFGAAFQAARDQGARELHAHPDDYYAFYLTTTAFNDAVVRESYPLAVHPLESFPKQGLELLEGTKAFLLKNGLAKDDFDISAWQWKEGGAQ